MDPGVRTRLGLVSLSRAPAGERAGTRTELALAGGAALVLLYGARESTKDVDVLVLAGASHSALDTAARRVADAAGLPVDWLNDAAKGYVNGIALGEPLFQSRSLRVRAFAAKLGGRAWCSVVSYW